MPSSNFVAKRNTVFYKKLKGIYRIFFVLYLALIFLGCQKKKNVVLISIDTLRADHVGCYGYTRNTTPTLDALANEGYLFRNVTSTSSWTAPAMASLFTALMPSQHNIKHGVCKSGNVYGQEALDVSHTTIAEVLREAGLVTIGISSNPHLTTELGFAQGFDYFIVCKFRGAEEVTNSAIELINKHSNGKPFFLWVHYFDPHWPYLKREPWINNYSPDYNDEMRRFYNMNLPKVRTMMKIKEDSDVLQTLIALYDSEINYVDQSVNKLLDAVPDQSDTMFIVVSDHGEGFLDHGTLDHGYQLYEESVRVPLIIKYPPVISAKKSFEVPCSIIDIPLTILDWLNIKNSYSFQGRSLLPLMTKGMGDEANESDRIIFSELNRFCKTLISLRMGRWKYINDLRHRKEELYDLVTDPYERKNVIEKRASIRKEMKGKVSRWLVTVKKARQKVKRVKLDKESVEKLKSLGYIE